MAKYKVIAKAKDSKCSHVKEGDKMVIEGTMVNLKETDSLCAVALGAIQYSLFMMGKATDPTGFWKAGCLYPCNALTRRQGSFLRSSRQVIEE